MSHTLISRTHIGGDSLGTVVLITVFALSAVCAAPYSSSDANAVAELDVPDLITHTHRLSNYLVAYDQGEMALSPALLQGVQVRAADTTMGNCNFDIVRTERLRLDGSYLQVEVVLWICNGKAD